MASTRNEICSRLWELYKVGRNGPDENGSAYASTTSETLKEKFAHELYHGARLEMAEATENAASRVVSLNPVQCTVLATKGKLVDRFLLKYNASDTVMSMAASVIDRIGIDWAAGMIRVVRTDGIDEFPMEAKFPSDLRKGDIAWVLEPFVATGEKGGKIWSEMSKEERVAAAATVRNPSSMPKYLQKRRIEVEAIEFNHDTRDAWVEIAYKEIEPFAKDDAEEQELLAELGLTALEAATSENSANEGAEAQASQGELAERPEGEEIKRDPDDHEAPHDASGITEEDLEALVEGLDDESNPELPTATTTIPDGDLP